MDCPIDTTSREYPSADESPAHATSCLLVALEKRREEEFYASA